MYIHYEINEDVNPIDKKIEVLKDFCILNSRSKTQEKAVRDILANCQSETQMDQKLYNVLRGTETLKEFIARHYMPSMRQH